MRKIVLSVCVCFSLAFHNYLSHVERFNGFLSLFFPLSLSLSFWVFSSQTPSLETKTYCESWEFEEKTRCLKRLYDTFLTEFAFLNRTNFVCVYVYVCFILWQTNTISKRTKKKKNCVQKLQPQLLLKLSSSSPYFAFNACCCCYSLFCFANAFAQLGATDLETSQCHISISCMH